MIKRPHRPIGIGVLGGGMISQIAHLPFLVADDRCRVKAIAESRPSLAAHLQGRFPGIPIVADYRSLLKDPDIDAVVLSVPRPAVGPLSLEILNAGKHLFTEKPMCFTLDQARKLARLADERQLLYGIGFMKRNDAGVRLARQLVRKWRASNQYGRLLHARFFDHSCRSPIPPPPHLRPAESREERFATWPLWPEWLPESLRGAYEWFVNVGSHDINLLHFFFSDPIELQAASMSVSGAIGAIMQSDGAMITFDYSTAAPGTWIQGAQFHFEDAALFCEIPAPMDIDGRSRLLLSDAAGAQELPFSRSEWSFCSQARHYISALTREQSLATDGTMGVRDMTLVEDIWQQCAKAP